MKKSANVVTNIAQEIICKWEKLRMRSQYGAGDNLQAGKIANAVPRTAVGGRYRGNRNPTPTKTYKRHPLTIVVSMDMIKRTERTVKSGKKEQKKEQKKNRKEVQKEEAERYVSKYSSH